LNEGRARAAAAEAALAHAAIAAAAMETTTAAAMIAAAAARLGLRLGRGDRQGRRQKGHARRGRKNCQHLKTSAAVRILAGPAVRYAIGAYLRRLLHMGATRPGREGGSNDISGIEVSELFQPPRGIVAPEGATCCAPPFARREG
jgi:hypothetical protein